MNVIETIKGWFNKMFSKAIQEELNLTPIISQNALDLMQICKDLYKGSPYWTRGKECDGVIFNNGFASVICSDMASLITDEAVITIDQDKYQDTLNAYLQKFVENDLTSKVEEALALGGMIFKPFINNGKIVIDCVSLLEFIPTATDVEGNFTSGIFVDVYTTNNEVYTKYEIHKLDITKSIYTIENVVYNKNDKRVSLQSVDKWANLKEKTTIQGLTFPLFTYFKLPINNNLTDDDISLGILSRNLQNFKALDEIYSGILWEYKATRTAVFVDDTMLDAEGELSDTDKRLYKVMVGGGKLGSEGLLTIFNPPIRDDSHFRGYDEMLKRIEDGASISHGTYSSAESIQRTATEVNSGKTKTSQTIRKFQVSLQYAINELVQIMHVYQYGAVAKDGEISVSCAWGDNIVTDRDMQFKHYLLMYQNGMLPKSFVVSWELNVDEVEADKIVTEADGQVDETIE